MEIKKGMKSIRNTGHYPIEGSEKRCNTCHDIKRTWQFRPANNRCNDCVNKRDNERKAAKKQSARIAEIASQLTVGQQIPLLLEG